MPQSLYLDIVTIKNTCSVFSPMDNKYDPNVVEMSSPIDGLTPACVHI